MDAHSSDRLNFKIQIEITQTIEVDRGHWSSGYGKKWRKLVLNFL